jgi:AcrR family transcriptional regulator
MDKEEAKRNELLDRGMVVFFNEGIVALTMEGLAAKLGVSKRTLYKYFPGKEIFIDAAAQRMMDKVRGQIEAHLAAETDFPRRLGGFFQIVETTLQPAARLFIRDVMTTTPWLWEKIAKYRHDRIFSQLELLLEEGRELGYIRTDIEPRLLAPLFIGMLEQIAQPSFLLNLSFPLAELIDAIASILLGGILNETGRQIFSGAAVFSLAADRKSAQEKGADR